MDRDLLSDYGIDYDKGIKNCVDNLDFYKKILSMFLQDACYSNAKTAYENHEYKKLFSYMHELKGVSGNAAFTELYNATVVLVELLRNGTDGGPELDSMFAAVEQAYKRTCEGIALIIS